MNRLSKMLMMVLVTTLALSALACANEAPSSERSYETLELPLDEEPTLPDTPEESAADEEVAEESGEVALSPMCVPVSMGGPGTCKPYKFWSKRAEETCGDLGLEVAKIKPHKRCSKTRFEGADVLCCGAEAQECVLEMIGNTKTCKSDATWTAIAAKMCAEQDKSLTHLTAGVACEEGKHRFARFECCGVATTCEPGTSWDDDLSACCPDAIWVADCLCPEGWDYSQEEVYDDQGCLVGQGCGCTPPECDDDSPVLCDMAPPECEEGLIAAAKNGCYECVDPTTCEAPEPVECIVSGCSGQICAPMEMMSTCEWKPEYACLSLTTCGPTADGICGWDMNDAYLDCLAEIEGQCEEGESWDKELDACCPDAIYVADCWCPDGWAYASTTDYDDAGCLLGYGCECVPPDCSDDEPVVCDIDVSVMTCPEGQVLAAKDGCYECVDPMTCEAPEPEGCYGDEECPGGMSCNADEVCLAPPGCEPGDPCPEVCYGWCVKDAPCDEGETWSDEVSACCPDAVYMPACAPCTGDVMPEIVEVYNDEGCLEGYTCKCPEVGQCDDGMGALCDMVPPECPEGLILAEKGGCYQCVDPDTCKAPDEPACVVSGCSGEICAPMEMMSTCQWSPEYACLSLTTCGQNEEGTCGWEMNDAYLECLANIGNGLCGEGETWDEELSTCCPSATYVSDCFCEDGQEPQQTQDYDDEGCFVGTGCFCAGPCDDGSMLICKMAVPNCPDDTVLSVQNGCYQCVDPGTCEPPVIEECKDGESWDNEVGACCPEAIYIADCWCDDGTYPQQTEDYDEQGCLLGYGCECVAGPCDDESAAVCMMVPPECEEGTILAVQGGCYQCVDPDTCEPPVVEECKDGESWDNEVGACCPEAIYIADCWCDDGTYPQQTEDYDEQGCLLGYGCECVSPSCTYNDEILEPGDVVDANDGCNTCTCSDTGEMQCTQMPCLMTCEDETGEYAIGESWEAADGCNTCVCMADGSAACTKMLCVPGCEVGADWYPVGESWEAADGCNTCTCMEEGMAACTEMACVTTCEDETGTYFPGESWDAADGCNVCTCMEGGEAACTKMLCPEGCEYEGAWYPAGETFPASDGCNSCWCTDSGEVACTLMGCVDPVCETSMGDYMVGESWTADDGCNTCTCMEGGVEACTKMACQCSPDDEWWREYVGDSPAVCATIYFVCDDNMDYFANDCGCGCQQSPNCPQWLNCMPPAEGCTAEDLEEFQALCPLSDIAW